MEKIKTLVISMLAITMAMFSTVFAQSSSDIYKTESFSVQASPSVKINTSGGHIEILNSNGNAEARTSGGHIDAENTQGDLNLRTSGGHISLKDVQGAVSGRTSGGSITANLLEVTGRLDLRTSGGSIKVKVPSETGYDLNLKGNRVNVRLQNFTGDSERGRIIGEMNGGGHSIQARTSGGSVNVEFS